MQKMKLPAGYFLIAQKLQEAASLMCSDDVQTRLRAAIRAAYEDQWCYVVAVFGDDKAGDVVYSCESDLYKASYTMSPGSTTVNTASAVQVLPFTTYEPQTAQVSEAGRRNSARDQKQLQAIHDSAMGLGAVCASVKESAGRPGAVGDTRVGIPGNGSTHGALGSDNLQVVRETLISAGVPEAKLSSVLARLGIRETLQTDSIQLVEGVATLENIVLKEARSDYEIKLIAPGKGSTAFYPAEVLKRDGPKVFTKETHVYLNHPTSVEEAARPEGDVRNLAGVLTSDAVYYESHAKGPGLYARMKVFADHAQLVEEKAAHVGMSIRACGFAEAGQVKEGVPVLKELTAAESVDVVTRAGAGGMILTEAARAAANSKEGNDDMDAAELKKLQESMAAQAVVNARLLERALKGDAREAAAKILAGITLAEVSKARVIDNVLREALPKTEAGELDAAKFAELVNQEAKREGSYVASLTGAGAVTGMGGGGLELVEADPIKAAEAAKRLELTEAQDFKEAVSAYMELGMDENAAKLAAKGRAA